MTTATLVSASVREFLSASCLFAVIGFTSLYSLLPISSLLQITSLHRTQSQPSALINSGDVQRRRPFFPSRAPPALCPPLSPALAMDPNRPHTNIPNLGIPTLPLPPVTTPTLPFFGASPLSAPALAGFPTPPLYPTAGLSPLQASLLLGHMPHLALAGPAALSVAGLPQTGLSPGLSLLSPQSVPNFHTPLLSGVDSLLRAAESSATPAEMTSSNLSKPPTARQRDNDSSKPSRNDMKSASKLDLASADSTEDELSLEDSMDDLPRDSTSARDLSSSDSENETAEGPAHGYSTRSRSARASGSATAKEKTKTLPYKPRLDLHDFDSFPSSAPPFATEWDDLELPLPAITLPKLNADARNLYIASLASVDNKAPAFDKLDSPTLWQGSSEFAPLHEEFKRVILVSKHVPHPRLLSTPPTISIDSASSKQISSAQSSSSTPSRGRKRARPTDSDDLPLGERSSADSGAPTAKKAKIKERSHSADPGDSLMDTDGVEDESEQLKPLISATTSSKRRISKADETVEIKRDADGNVITPLVFGSITVVSLGKVLPNNDKFHSRRYIFPLGYTSKRTYYSLKNPAQRCSYTQEVLATTTEPIEPLFRLTCEDDPEHPIQSNTPSGVWSEALERIKPQREAQIGRALHSTISGPEQFGFSHPIIHQLIETLPGALSCANYDPNQFFVPDPRGKRTKTKEPSLE